MPITPKTTIRLPEWLKKSIQERTKNLTKFIIDACVAKLNSPKERNNPNPNL
jgi:hypothetical protein